jgi:hypothetical protein
VREDFLIIYMFGSKDVRGREERGFNVNMFRSRGEGREDKIKLLFYPYNLARVS